VRSVANAHLVVEEVFRKVQGECEQREESFAKRNRCMADASVVSDTNQEAHIVCTH
jgi:hypothetical protein